MMNVVNQTILNENITEINIRSLLINVMVLAKFVPNGMVIANQNIQRITQIHCQNAKRCKHSNQQV